MMRYDQLHHNLYTDTLINGTVPKRGENVQVYASSYGWTRAYDIQKESNCHEILSILFQCDGLPMAMIMDGSKE